MAQAVLEARNLVVRYGTDEVVRIPSLKVEAQEILVIMGPNGAGKSTLLRVLGFLEAPTEGQVIFQGQEVSFRSRDLLPLHRRTAVVFQEPLLLDTTVFENVALGLKLRGIKKRKEKVGRWLDRFGISHLYDRSSKNLSDGEARRASLARAFVLDPELLLLDEPFSALDPPTRDSLLADLKLILTETRTATVFITHDRNEAMMLGDRVGVMMDGRIAQLDTSERVFTSPIDEKIARFLGIETILSGRALATEDGVVTVEVHGRQVTVAGVAQEGEQVLVCVRPEEVMLSKVETGPSNKQNGLEGQVIKTIPLGPFFRIVVDCGAPVVALMTRQSFRAMGFEEGERVRVSFKATAAQLVRNPG